MQVTEPPRNPGRFTVWELLGEAGLARLERPVAPPPVVTLPAPKVRVLQEQEWPLEGSVRSDHAGLLLLVGELVALDLPGLVRAAGWPSTTQLSALRSVLSLLALKLCGRRRRSHVEDVVHDHSLGLFAGLNVLPHAWPLTASSYRTGAPTSRRCSRRCNPACGRPGCSAKAASTSISTRS